MIGRSERRGSLQQVNWDSRWQRPMDQKHACEMDLCILQMQLLLPESRVWTQGGGRWEGRGSGEYGIVWRLQLGSARAYDAKRRSLESHRGQVLK